MKKKLKTVFILIAGIIVFQGYWTFNSYKVNKERFDGNIDSAMRLAMEDCKKDYFDSMRVVLVKRISPPAMKMIVDSFYENDIKKDGHKYNRLKYNIWLLNPKGSLPRSFNPKYYRVEHKEEPIFIKNLTNKTIVIPSLSPTISVFETDLNLYRKKIPHKASLPEVLIEMSFYERYLLSDITSAFFWALFAVPNQLRADGHAINDIYRFPPHYKQADSLKLSRYLRTELDKMRVRSSFNLAFSTKPVPPQKPNIHYSETNEYLYKYHGFTGLGIVHQDNKFFARAMFRNPQYSVLRSMTITLVLSTLLIALTIYCFLYITRTILEQKKLAELKDDFINNMTHELKTPIATITVAIEGLQKFNALNDPEKTQRYLQTSKEELTRLNELVSKVLNVATFENKEIVLVKDRIKVDELLNEVIEAEKAKTGKTVNITYNNKDKVEIIEADRFHFRNVLVNLIDNAIKYSDEPVYITITCSKDGNNAVFSVKDKGIGIPPEHINQVFDKFHRVPTGNIHNVKGTGLGLSYVRYIVEVHGGSVTVKSEINKGSEFIVTLP